MYFKNIYTLENTIFKNAQENYDAFNEEIDSEEDRVRLLNDLHEIQRELASTLINLCSLYSSMGMHKIALKHVLEANGYLESLFLKLIKSHEIN